MLKTNSFLRPGIKDIWNAFMVEDALFCEHDIPYCPTTATKLPSSLISWREAKIIYKKQMRQNKDFKYNAFVCFYVDDQFFDGEREGIWKKSGFVLKLLKHFEGAITPDFSTYQDFPEPIKTYNTYRMRAFGYWLGRNGIPVINNVRWGTKETFDYCFVGIPTNSIIAIGTVGGSPYKLVDRERFDKGLNKLIDILHPHTIIVYGSATYPCFDRLKKQKINIISYPSHTARAFINGDHAYE